MNAPTLNGNVWTAHSVPLSGIEAEIEKLWHAAAQEMRRSAAPATKDGTGNDESSAPAALARARVLNFIVYASVASGDADAEGPVQIVTQIIATHPFRSILIVADESAGAGSLEATVTAHAVDRTDGRIIIHEQVRINARGPVSDGLPSIVLPLLLPDLPTYTWWPGDPPVGHAFMRQFVKACDRLIVDSAGFLLPLVSLVRHADFVASARKYHTFGDLLWNQLCEWRSVITRFFDNQLYRSCLDNITSVTIEYSGPGTRSRQDGQLLNPCPALLMAGWLCSRLDWNPSACETSNDLLRYHLAAPSGRAVELILQPYGGSNPVAPTVESIRAKALCGEQAAYFAAERQASTPVVNVTASVPGTSDVHLSIKLVTSDLATLLHKELDQGGQESGYEAALAVAADLARFALNNSRT